MWDFLAAQRVDTFIANSATTAKRIAKYYRRESDIIHPGIDETRFVLQDEKKDYFLALGRIVPYKRFDLLVETFNLNGLPLKIVTSTRNPLQEELQKKSLPNIEWVFNVTNDAKIELYQHARALIFPPEEDFGMVPVEAMLCGTPVIAYGKA
jgi:glycosyltransferase involved in cell wall biosynthesis